MIKRFNFIILTLAILAIPAFALAQGMMGANNVGVQDDGHTALEEAKGKDIWNKLQASDTDCPDLSDDDYAALGEYFMGQMTGASHAAMNNMMIQMMGEEGEEQMHVVMGKRMSGCEPYAPIPQGAYSSGIFPVMGGMMGGSGMMGGTWSSGFNNFNNNPTSMMNYVFSNFGGFGWIFMILFWALVIIGIIVLVKWLASQGRNGGQKEKSALDILKERYAKGEIDKKEFEEKSKDLY